MPRWSIHRRYKRRERFAQTQRQVACQRRGVGFEIQLQARHERPALPGFGGHLQQRIRATEPVVDAVVRRRSGKARGLPGNGYWSPLGGCDAQVGGNSSSLKSIAGIGIGVLEFLDLARRVASPELEFLGKTGRSCRPGGTAEALRVGALGSRERLTASGTQPAATRGRAPQRCPRRAAIARNSGNRRMTDIFRRALPPLNRPRDAGQEVLHRPSQSGYGVSWT
jgi:hypothetical protein